jgi:tetratricopeptide (TPR) repeat protein
MRNGNIEDALVIFELNTELFPNESNTYDSYGECLLLLGDTINAIKAYKKSIELNPGNTSAEEVLEKIE